MKKTGLRIFIIVIFFVCSNLNYGQAPNLGSASGFVLFTVAGAFENVGEITFVKGDVGTNLGVFNAFPQGTLDGQKYIEDITSAQVATDIGNANTELNGIIGGTVLGIELGNQTLIPGVYRIGAASTLNGDLTLNGQGDPDALFIFIISGALSVSSLSNVLLTNSVVIGNVYWQINGDFSIGAGSVFKGTAIVSGAISLLDGSSLDGRGFSCGGAISLNNNSIVPLPAKLLSFIAQPEGLNVHLKWTTVSELNNNYFSVQRSVDGISFEELLRVAGAGNSNMIINYSAIDNNPKPDISYYHLKQTDFDGKFSFSNLVAVYMKSVFYLDIYPNPMAESVTVIVSNASPGNVYEFSICNVLGTEVFNTIISTNISHFDTGFLSQKLYYYRIYNNKVLIKSGKLISQK